MAIMTGGTNGSSYGPLLFAISLSASVTAALIWPDALAAIKVSPNVTLGTGCFCLGLATSWSRAHDLLGRAGGLGVLGFSAFLGMFLWPAVGLAVTVLALQNGFGFPTAVGLAVLAACPVGGPSAIVNMATADGSVECGSLMCLLGTPAALFTFPYIYEHFGLLLLDQPEAAAAANAANAALRSELGDLSLPSAVTSALQVHAFLATALPLLAGVGLRLLLGDDLRARLRSPALAVASFMIVLTASTKTAANAGLVAAAGWPLVGAVVAMHVGALVLGHLIPRGVGCDGVTCRTAALQSSMRNPALGLILVSLLFGGSPHFNQLVAPCVVSIFVQNLLGAWSALLYSLFPLRPATYLRTTSMDKLARSTTFKRPRDGASSPRAGGSPRHADGSPRHAEAQAASKKDD